MPKYYVQSGQLQRIVVARTPFLACEKALQQADGETIGRFFYVDQRGFRGESDVVDTSSLPEKRIKYQKLVKNNSFDIEDELMYNEGMLEERGLYDEEDFTDDDWLEEDD